MPETMPEFVLKIILKTCLFLDRKTKAKTEPPVVDMIPAVVAVTFEAFHMEWIHKAVVAGGALGIIGWHYLKRK